MSNFYMMVGIPGSGKSTYAKELKTKYNATLIGADDIRLEICGSMEDQSKNGVIFSKIIPQRIKDGLAKGDVVFDATNYNRKSRREWLILAKTLGARTIVYLMKTSFEESRRRNAARDRVVPDFVIDRMIQGWEAPDMNIEKIDELIFI